LLPSKRKRVAIGPVGHVRVGRGSIFERGPLPTLPTDEPGVGEGGGGGKEGDRNQETGGTDPVRNKHTKPKEWQSGVARLGWAQSIKKRKPTRRGAVMP